MTEIKVVVVNGKEKAIEVKDGLVLVFCGHGPNDAAFWKRFEECGDAEFAAAEEVTAADFNPTPWGDSLDNEAPKTTTEQDEYKNNFDKAVDFLAHCKGEDFLELVRYAKAHGNRFFNCVKEVANIVNADDAYCSALIRLSRPLGEVVERKTFELFSVVDESDLCEENFLDMWKALQTISYFCG